MLVGFPLGLGGMGLVQGKDGQETMDSRRADWIALKRDRVRRDALNRECRGSIPPPSRAAAAWQRSASERAMLAIRQPVLNAESPVLVEQGATIA